MLRYVLWVLAIYRKGAVLKYFPKYQRISQTFQKTQSTLSTNMSAHKPRNEKYSKSRNIPDFPVNTNTNHDYNFHKVTKNFWQKTNIFLWYNSVLFMISHPLSNLLFQRGMRNEEIIVLIISYIHKKQQYCGRLTNTHICGNKTYLRNPSKH
jgi:hypothetical protein